MAFAKGKSGNPSGGRKQKLCYEALMLELKSRDDKAGLRAIMANLFEVALDKEHKDWLSAVKEIANRLDGTPVATVDMNINDTRTVEELPDSELAQLIRENSGRGTAEAPDGEKEPDSLH